MGYLYIFMKDEMNENQGKERFCHDVLTTSSTSGKSNAEAQRHKRDKCYSSYDTPRRQH